MKIFNFSCGKGYVLTLVVARSGRSAPFATDYTMEFKKECEKPISDLNIVSEAQLRGGERSNTMKPKIGIFDVIDHSDCTQSFLGV